MSPLQVAMMRARNVPRPIKPELVFEVMMGDFKPSGATPQHIIAVTARFYRMTVKDLREHRRFEGQVLARQVASYLIYSIAGIGATDIAREFGLDPSTIQHTLGKIRKIIETDDKLASDVAEIRRRIVAR